MSHAKLTLLPTQLLAASSICFSYFETWEFNKQRIRWNDLPRRRFIKSTYHILTCVSVSRSEAAKPARSDELRYLRNKGIDCNFTLERTISWTLPFHIKCRFQLENLRSRENCSRFLFPFVLQRVWRSVFSISTFSAVFIVFFYDFVFIVWLVSFFLHIRLMWRRWLWWRWRWRCQRRWQVFRVVCWTVCEIIIGWN